MARAVRCDRCDAATLGVNDRHALMLPGGPIAVVVICSACLRALIVWLGGPK